MGIDVAPAFEWWVGKRMRKRHIIISTVKIRMIHKLGRTKFRMRAPLNSTNAKAIDLYNIHSR